ncbi:MAG: YhcH/YjgK/YiaL family protein [Candidatus Sumerlaeota bacterium]|nr:YhcH/YjgK/YiaL family protein [Candidatus Sumerlaeota bacterium]
MIIDRLENAALYEGLGRGIAAALKFLRQTDWAAMPLEKHEIDGDNLFALVQEYETRPRDTAAWEAHRKYIDVQYVISGEEAIGYANAGQLKAGEFNEKDDYMPLEGAGDVLTLPAGTFMILWPQDAHAPCLAVSQPRKVKKVVIKVKRG